MHITLVDLPQSRVQLLPLTYLKSIADLRVGILTIKEKWAKRLDAAVYISSEDYLTPKYPPCGGPGLVINSCILPNDSLINLLRGLPEKKQLRVGNFFVASHVENVEDLDSLFKYPIIQEEFNLLSITRPWDLFVHCSDQIKADYALVTKDRKSESIEDPHTIVYGNDVFLEPGAKVRAAILNSEEGPIFLGKDTVVHEGSIIKGPFSLGDGSHVNMGSKIRKGTSIGPYCKVGGEISNSVIQGYSNKGHDGFLGNSVIGEWCNLGADTNNSNLKNNYGLVKMWDYQLKQYVSSDRQFCGLVMGDHSKCGINTMFNTGTTVGVSANIFGAGFPEKFIPSFSWGPAKTYQLDKAFDTIERVMARRGLELKETERDILHYVYKFSSQFRSWENS